MFYNFQIRSNLDSSVRTTPRLSCGFVIQLHSHPVNHKHAQAVSLPTGHAHPLLLLACRTGKHARARVRLARPNGAFRPPAQGSRSPRGGTAGTRRGVVTTGAARTGASHRARSTPSLGLLQSRGGAGGRTARANRFCGRAKGQSVHGYQGCALLRLVGDGWGMVGGGRGGGGGGGMEQGRTGTGSTTTRMVDPPAIGA